MSRLRELRLHGFKSFADPTRFVFEPGVNAVIGPNGSGKSNMADAVRWVLGEQSNRSLRTRRADDVIFAGSEQRRSLGMAEAVLTLDNADGWLPIEFAEVSIGRRAYRSGETEYLINGARARLRDVVALLGEGRLGANELVVVGQGTVDAALSLRPEERRQLFEEAAGVKNLQVRRNEASGRLARALDNLTRVSDLIGELKPQVRRLALQAEHQQQHASLGTRARALVLETHRRAEQQVRTALGDARRRAAAAEAALAAFRDDAEQERRAVADAEAAYWTAEEAARTAAAQHQTTREVTIRAESRAEALAARLRETEVAIASATDALAAARDELAAVGVGEREAVLDPVLAAAARTEERWRRAVGALGEADADLLAAEEALAALRQAESGRIAAVARQQEDDARVTARRERAATELEELRRRSDEATAAARSAREAVDAADRQRGSAAADLDRAAAEREDAQERADTTRQHATELAERLGVLRAELAGLEDRARHAGRLGERLASAGWSPLLDVLSAPDEAWPAIEALVGGELEQALLWHDGSLSALVADARGTARLLGAGGETPDGRTAALRAVGATRTLADWVGESAPASFGRAVVAPDLEALIAGWQDLPPGWSAVTAEGDLADARGIVVVRGRGEPPGGAAARAHARRRELAQDVARLDGERRGAAAAAHEAANALRAARDAHVSARERLDAADALVRRRRAELETAVAGERRLADDMRRVEAELAAASPGMAQPTSTEDARIAVQLHELTARAAEARERRDRAAGERDAARAAWTESREAAAAAELRAANERQSRSALEARITGLEAEIPTMRERGDMLRADHDAARQHAAEARSADEAAAERRTAAEAERDRLRAQLLELERTASSAAGRRAELEQAAHTTTIEVTRREDALAGLERERQLALDSLGADEGQAEPDATLRAELAALDDEAVAAELRTVRRTLAQIGSVNPFATQEHAELSGRLEGLSSQDHDLREAISATDQLIGTLDTQIAEQFDRAFTAIGERFDEYCRLLFAGGSASLQLGEEGDGEAPGGIEIVVRPPGKRLQRLAMLSGGERALTGVALLFAMLSVNPVPFCILDEVDAALDEANIGRFADALRRLADEIDFVVITHNRATIEVADTIYGVTMTDAAVSRVLSLRLADVPLEVGA